MRCDSASTRGTVSIRSHAVRRILFSAMSMVNSSCRISSGQRQPVMAVQLLALAQPAAQHLGALLDKDVAGEQALMDRPFRLPPQCLGDRRDESAASSTGTLSSCHAAACWAYPARNSSRAMETFGMIWISMSPILAAPTFPAALICHAPGRKGDGAALTTSELASDRPCSGVSGSSTPGPSSSKLNRIHGSAGPAAMALRRPGKP